MGLRSAVPRIPIIDCKRCIALTYCGRSTDDGTFFKNPARLAYTAPHDAASTMAIVRFEHLRSQCAHVWRSAPVATAACCCAGAAALACTAANLGSPNSGVLFWSREGPRGQLPLTTG